ncbi:AAA family ATPase [Nocardioides cheoyonin]|uniref:AAA family ATPase n=1 Tax=Nocardioides cheoyonin TaxID=3156615 RepID=UPI0032B41DCA
MALTGDWPHWLRDIDANLVVTPQYVVHGNIRDLHLIQPAGQPLPQPRTTVESLWAGLAERGFTFALYHSPPTGLCVEPAGNPEAEAAAVDFLKQCGVALGEPISWTELGTVLTRLTRRGHGATTAPGSAALILDYQSQQRPAGDPPDHDLHEFMLCALASVHQSSPSPIYNPVVWLVDRPSDLPTWLVGGSDGIRQISIPAPDLDLRRRAALLFGPALPGSPGADSPDARREALAARFASPRPDLTPAAAKVLNEFDQLATVYAESTEGLSLRAMSVINRLSQDAGLDAAHVDDAARAYKLGLIENKWKQDALRRRVAKAEQTLAAKVLGQPRAVAHAAAVLIRSTMALSGAWQGPRSSGPRGVMFFAGPTGVGKTELAKAITELVFGDPDAYIRFDMSEFASEHTEARLIGAPPGYIGHGHGGELTDAVRRKPMSVVLFDEIEKAAPRILDKFLQILSDGRLTDGSGATVYFTDTIVIFTSNLGVAGVDPASPEYNSQVLQSVERSFRDDLNRPELLGRIGDNIVVFDFLTRDIGRALVRDRYVPNVLSRVQAEHDIELTIAEPVLAQLADACTHDMTLGGRGVGQELDTHLVNPLARALAIETRQNAKITAITERDGRYEVILG